MAADMPIRVPEATYQLIRQLAGDGPMHVVITEAVESLRRRRLLEATNAAFAALRADESAWAEEEAERAAWEATLGDDLGD